MKFPITEAQFKKWLTAKPRAWCDTPMKGCGCPIENAVYELTGKVIQVYNPGQPQWVRTVAWMIDSFTDWHTQRQNVLRMLALRVKGYEDYEAN